MQETLKNISDQKEDDLINCHIVLSNYITKEGKVILKRLNDKIKIYKDKHKKQLLLPNPKSEDPDTLIWDLSDATQKKKFLSIKDNLWIEGYAVSSNSGDTGLQLTYRPIKPLSGGVLQDIIDTMKCTVVKVEKVILTSNVASNSPMEFKGGRIDLGDPCHHLDSERAPSLVIFYDQVTNSQGTVLNFDVNLEAKILPKDISLSDMPQIIQNKIKWKKMERTPPSPKWGELEKATLKDLKTKFQKPIVGGVYEIEFELLKGQRTETLILLPLAYADMTRWLDKEVRQIKNWAIAHKQLTEMRNYSKIPLVTRKRMLDVWINLSANYFDYVFKPIDKEERTPCEAYIYSGGNQGMYHYVTVNNVVVHGSKLNNMLWSIFGHYWGWNDSMLKMGAMWNELQVDRRLDNPTSQKAISLGTEIYLRLEAGNLNYITDVLTEDELRNLQDPNYLWEEKLWPSPYPADLSKSTFIRPRLPTKKGW